MRLGTASGLCVGWLLVGSFAGCARTQPQDEVSADAGLDAMGDGALVDGKADGDLGPPAKVSCPPALDACEASETTFAVAFEPPPSVELLQARNGQFLGIDRASSEIVIYEIGHTPVAGKLPEVAESFRLPTAYTRAQLGAEGILACGAAGCAFVTRDRALPVPESVEPVAIFARCVGGNGIVCFDADGVLANLVPPASLSAKVAAFGFFLSARESLVSSADGKLRLIRSDGTYPPFEPSLTEPLDSVATVGGYASSRTWAGRTQSGFLAVGDDSGGTRCDVRAEDVQLTDYSSVPLRFLSGDRFVVAPLQARYAFRGCSTTTLPAGTLGHTSASCGLGGSLLVFTAHRIYATLISCPVG